MIQSCTILKKITEFIKREIPEVKSLLSRRPLLSTRDPKNTISIEEASKLIKGKLTEILDKYQETSRDELETAISCWIVTTPLSRTLFNTRGYIRKQIQDVILERFKEASSKIIEDFKKEVKILSENRIKDILKKKSTGEVSEIKSLSRVKTPTLVLLKEKEKAKIKKEKTQVKTRGRKENPNRGIVINRVMEYLSSYPNAQIVWIIRTIQNDLHLGGREVTQSYIKSIVYQVKKGEKNEQVVQLKDAKEYLKKKYPLSVEGGTLSSKHKTSSKK